MSWGILLITTQNSRKQKFSSPPNLLEFLKLSLSYFQSKISLWVGLLGSSSHTPEKSRLKVQDMAIRDSLMPLLHRIIYKHSLLVCSQITDCGNELQTLSQTHFQPSFRREVNSKQGLESAPWSCFVLQCPWKNSYKPMPLPLKTCELLVLPFFPHKLLFSNFPLVVSNTKPIKRSCT